MPDEIDLASGLTGTASPNLRDARVENGIHLTPLKKARAASGPRCRFCPGHEFRRSRFRPKDAFKLLLLRYPVRCLRCRQRQTINVFAARRAESSKARTECPPNPTDSWRNFTLDRRPDFAATAQPMVPVPAATPVRSMEPLQPRLQPVPVPPPPPRIAVVTARRSSDENAIW
jgi:hypothetical protein